MTTPRKNSFWTAFVLIIVALSSWPLPAQAAEQVGNFSLQVTPSPLVVTLQPGQTKQQEIKIKNAGTSTEHLKIESRSFSIDNTSGEIKLGETPPADVASFASFSRPTFSVEPGQWYTESVTLHAPKDAGFSYSFAFIVSRQGDPQPGLGERLIKGSIAVFTLINIDRPGATRQLEVTEFKASERLYQFLPTTLSVKVKNTGNTIVQPYGNIFIQSGSKNSTPLATLPVNEAKAYILPGTERTLSVQWTDGFPAYKAAADGSNKQSLAWDLSKISSLRVGNYTAKLVLVYNDGQHDTPIERETNFWVMPWVILLIILVVVALIVVGVWSVVRKAINVVHRPKRSSTLRKIRK